MTSPTAVFDKPMGIEGVIYVGPAGTTPTLLLNDDQKAEINCKNTVVKWSTRGNRKKQSKYGDQEITLTFTVVKDNLNPQFIALQTAAHTQGYIAVKALDKLSGFGIDADWVVEDKKESQDMGSNNSVDFTLALVEIYRNLTWNDSTASTAEASDPLT